MNIKKTKPRRVAVEPKPFDQARDELFQHIMRCEVAGSHPDHQKEWFDETLAYMAERYHELSAVELGLGGGARLGVVLRRARSNGR